MGGNTAEEEGIVVAKGRYVVPKGVAVEELDGGKNKLRDECPDALRDLLEEKGLVGTYDKFVKGIVEESHTRDLFGNWRDKEFESIIDIFRDDFADKGVRVALCKRKSGSGTYRWIEFIDVDALPTYVPQYDVANFSGQVIKTVYNKIEFPNGVAVEELKSWGKARNRLKQKRPIYVQQLLEKKDVIAEYEALVKDCVEAGVGSYFKNWDLEKLKDVFRNHQMNFEKKGVSVFISHKEEWVSYGAHGHMEYFRWIEFVDREEQPNYQPQRDAESNSEKCIIS